MKLPYLQTNCGGEKMANKRDITNVGSDTNGIQPADQLKSDGYILLVQDNDVYALPKSVWATEMLNSLSSELTTVNLRIDGKVDKVDGKSLSANDYTDAEKNKLSNVEESANNYILPVDVVRDSTYVKTDENFTNAKSDKLDRINTSWKLTVPTTGWTNNTNYFSITLVATGMLPTDIPIIDVDLNGTESNYDEKMRDYEKMLGAANGTDTITLNFLLVPTTPFDIRVVI